MPFLDSRALLLKGCAVSDLVLCCIMITAHAFESQRRDLSDEITKRMAMRYLEETSVSALTDDELRAVLLLSLRTSFVDCGTHAEATLDEVFSLIRNSTKHPLTCVEGDTICIRPIRAAQPIFTNSDRTSRHWSLFAVLLRDHNVSLEATRG